MRGCFAAVLVVLVPLLVVAVDSDDPVFLEVPSLTVVAENDVAVFRCRISGGAQGWAVNGTFTSEMSNPDIETHSVTVSDGGNPIHTLTIVARSGYNGTTVQCFVFPENINSSATLHIQGPLAAVTDLTAVAETDFILFHWGAPFSLNLTNNNTDIEPDITYCVEVFNSTDNGTEMMVTQHGLTETRYNFTANEKRPCDLFAAVVTPVNGAGNGSASEPVNGTFFDAPDVREAVVSEVEFIYDVDETITTVMVSIDFGTIVYICTCDVTINTNDGRDPSNDTIELVENTGQRTFTIPFHDTVPDRIWSMVIVLENSAGFTTTGQIHLSTHDVQDITTVSGSPSGMEFNVTFATNSRALGCVVIVKSSSMETVLVKYRDIDSTSDQFIITGLPPASYDMAGFDLEGSSRLPGRYRAVNAPLESSESGPQPLGVEGGVMAEAVLITPSGGAVCVDCTIPAGINATECVFIIHPSESLEEIETVVVMSDEEHCIPVPSSMEYSVTSFGRLDSRIVSLSYEPSPSEAGPGTPSVVGAVIVIVVLALIIIVAVSVGLVLWRRRGKRVRDVTLSDTEKATAPKKDTQPAAPLLVQDTAGGPPPPPQESEDRITVDSGSPNPSVSSVDSLSEPIKQEPLYDAVKPPMDKNMTQKSGTGSVYANTVPDKSIKAPPGQDTEVPYAEPAGFKSDGKLYSIPQLKAPKKKTSEPEDELTVVYTSPIDHIKTAANTKPAQPAPPVATSAPEVPPLTIALLCDVLYEIRGAWKALAEQLKQSDDLIDEIETNNEKDEACLQQVLEYWFKNYSDFQHTWSEVVTALGGIGQQALADSIHNTYVLPEVEDLPGTPVHEHSMLVSLPPSSLQPPQQGPVLQGSFAVSQSPAPNPISKHWSVPLQEFEDVLKTGLVAPEPQQWRSLTDVGEKEEATRPSVPADWVSEKACETDSVAYPHFVESAGNEDKPSLNVFPTQETQQDYTASLVLSSEDNSESMDIDAVQIGTTLNSVKPAPRNGPDCKHGCS